MAKKKSNKTRKLVWIIVIFMAIILIILIGARAYLYINVLIGNDLIVKIEADKENIFLQHGESSKVKITSYAITNVFCETKCNSKFIDLSNDFIIEEDNFNLKLPKTKEFMLNASDLGSGLNVYRFDIECNSPHTFLCQTKAKAIKNSLLITMTYEPNDNEKSLKQKLQQELSSLLSKIQYYYSNLNEIEKALNRLEKTAKIEELVDRFEKNKKLIIAANKSSENLINYWNQEDYENLNDKFNNFNESFSIYESEYLSFNNSVYSNLSVYNSIVDNITKIGNQLGSLKKQNMTENSTKNLNSLIEEYNNITIALLIKDLLYNKSDIANQLFNKTFSFSYEFSNNSKISNNLSIFNMSKIFIEDINKTDYILPLSIEKCCINEKCDRCCDESCYNEKEKYPIIFLHGHSFNEKVSAEASLESFEEIQRKLENQGYLNAGSLLLSSSNETSNVWSKINSPLSIKTSYYFDIRSNEGKNVIIQTKTDNLDTYTLRLRDIINEIKLKTNREKVVIIAHSMGGLIARRYLQVFGEGDIEELILITTPNKGISGNTLNLCSVFGTKLECNDMDKDSLFINKLNNAQTPSIPIHNIIGIGCETNEENGDGVVGNSSQYLEYAKNYYVTGICSSSEFKYLHTEILDSEKYPKIIEILKEALKK